MFGSRTHWLHTQVLGLYFFVLAALDLRCRTKAFSSCGEWGLLSSCRAQAPHWGGFFLQSTVSVVVARELCCLEAHGIFPDQGSNPCPLDWRQIPNHWTTREALAPSF